MPVLLTGADGYIGARLSDYLDRRGFEIVGIDTGFFSSDQLYAPPASPVRRFDTRRVLLDQLAGFDAVVQEYPGCPVVLGPPSSDGRSYFVSFRQIREQLRFEPHWSLARGVADLRRYFDKVQLTVERLEAPPFTRLKQIRALLNAGLLDRNLFRMN